MTSLRTLACLAALCVAACSDPATPAVDASTRFDVAPADVAPSKRVAVGVTTRTFEDTSRPTPANGSAPATPSRRLVTEVWYPIAPGIAGASPTRDAPPDPSRRGLPLVIFVHGSDGSRLGYAYLTEALAEAGHVVVAPDLPLTALSTPGGASDLHVDDQPGDVVFVADQMRALSANARDPLAGMVDASSYVVAGHSTGGTIALLAAFAPDAHDPRVRGVVALSPCACFFGESFFLTRVVPMMVIAGSDDRFVPPSTNGLRAYSLAGAPRFYATLIGGDHLGFTGISSLRDTQLDFATPTTTESDIAMALARYGGGTACTPAPAPGTDPLMSADDQHARTVELVRAFADSVLRASGASLAALSASPPTGVLVQHDP